jgi:hypothetical protein
MSYSRPIEMSEYPPRSVIWEADDYGLGADESTNDAKEVWCDSGSRKRESGHTIGLSSS